jgi:hypothetical protein
MTEESAEAEAPPPAPAPAEDPFEARLKKLEVEQRRIWIRFVDFRGKLFAMQQAFVERLGLSVCELGDPAAEIFPVEIRRSPEAPVRVFAFGSMGANSGIPPKQFFKSFKDRNCEVLFFKDFRQCWYQQGLLGLSRDIPTTTAFLQKLQAEDPRPIVTIGASSGAFAAILFGAMLGAQKIVAFSPQTEVTKSVFQRFKTEDSDESEMGYDGYWADLAQVLRDNPLQGRAQVFYSRRAPFDAAQAQRLEGLKGIELKPLEWNGHNTAVLLRNSGQLDPLIDDLVGG